MYLSVFHARRPDHNLRQIPAALAYLGQAHIDFWRGPGRHILRTLHCFDK